MEKEQKPENKADELPVELSDLLPCTCPGMQDAMKAGLRRMKKAGAPIPAVGDYITDMATGQWVHCKCAASATVE